MSFIGFPQLHKYGLVKPFATRRTTRFFLDVDNDRKPGITSAFGTIAKSRVR